VPVDGPTVEARFDGDRVEAGIRIPVQHDAGGLQQGGAILGRVAARRSGGEGGAGGHGSSVITCT
jgi:hypothetical protein